jgi:hypothetical protein
MPTWTGAGADNNWSTTGNWDTGVIPTNLTDAIFDGVTGANPNKNCTVNAANRPCANFNTTGYTGTITFTFDVQVNGNVTLGAGMGFAGTGFINIRFTANSQTRTLDVATGLTVPRLSYITSGGNTGCIISLTRNTTVTNLTNSEGSAVSITISPASGSVTLTVDGGTFNHSSSGRTSLNANTTLEFKNSCTLTSTAITPFIGFGGGTIKTLSAATLTVAANWQILTASGTIDFSLGTVNFGTTLFTCNLNATINFPSSVGTFYDVAATVGTLTLSSDIIVSRDFTAGTGGNTGTINGAYKFIVQRNLILIAGGTLTGNSTLSFEGTANNGAISLTGAGTGTISISSLVIAKSTATFTLNNTASLVISSANYTLTSGTIVHSSGTITFSGTQNITHTVAATYNNITIGGTTPTKTLSGNVWNIAGTLTVNATATFAGTIGWTAATFSSIPTGSTTITIQNGVTYTVTNSLVMQGNSPTTAILFFTSNSATVRAIFTLDNGASQFVYFVRATRIDSGAGQTIWDVPGTISPLLTDTINWNQGSRPAPIAYSYIL